MGRLTLNVLLSFAQFERELASERVRDKVAASRRKSDSAPASIGVVERVVIALDHLMITTAGTADGDGANQEFRIAWSKAKDAAAAMEDNGAPEIARNESLTQSIVRAHAWVDCLRDGAYESIEQLAEENRLHPKVVRLALRLAFLSPDVTSAILEGRQLAGLSLAQIPKLLALPWAEHRRLLG